MLAHKEQILADSQLTTTAPLIRCVERPQPSNLLAAFTFLIPPSLVKGIRNEVQTSEFSYTGLLWQARVMRNELHIDVQLEFISRPPSISAVSETDSPNCGSSTVPNLTNLKDKKMVNFLFSVDLQFIVLNRQHFSENQSFSLPGAEFTPKHRSHCSKSFIETSYLSEGQFLFDDGSFLLELEFINSSLKMPLHLSTKSDLLSLEYGGKRPYSYADDEAEASQCIKFYTRTQNLGPRPWRFCITVPPSRLTSKQWPPERIGMYCYYSKEGRPKRRRKFFDDTDILTVVFDYTVAPHIETQQARFRIAPSARKSNTVYMAPDPAAALVSNLQTQIQSHVSTSSPASAFRPRLKLQLSQLLFKQSTSSALTCIDEGVQLFTSPLVDTEGFPWNLYVHFDKANSLDDRDKKNNLRDTLVRACLQPSEPRNAVSRVSENTIRVACWCLDVSGLAQSRQCDMIEQCTSFASRFQQLHGGPITECGDDTPKDYVFLGEAFSPSHCLWPLRSNNLPQPKWKSPDGANSNVSP
ncbi:unnamed protein product [Dibothriocephalus latus]|uniref:MATH domain-containing protein n=1 Tax=Dibothriocephalus latus TaxID=60516 RepID=A0A3P7NPU2_DIBLA|nr:unnamed protein product [Dibothriocephalus latus]